MARLSTGRDWATWLEEAMERVANCNVRMAKERRRTGGMRQILHQEDSTGGAPATKRPHKRRSEGNTLGCPRPASEKVPSLRGTKSPPQLRQLAQISRHRHGPRSMLAKCPQHGHRQRKRQPSQEPILGGGG
ncbi:unnamed protein product [Sphagnum troendelagicum]|uniref:Uncharacterized protein n=1 Tax=Sphagnum troendelagicum TaxID=128251 RepID=A0ABP0TF91_9BRYO